MSDKFYITTPIFYPNGTPHIGHAYTVIATDVLARFARLDGRDVFFLSGTDEHGTKMQQTAIAQGITPLELADQNSSVFQQMLQTFNCSNDDFIRTTQPRHHAACQEIWKKMQDNGDIYLSKYGGWYSVRQEAFFDEKETSVSEDGIRREPLGSPVEWVEEENYYFKLSNYADRLLELYENQPDFVGPSERLNEVASFVKSGLRDFSISRTTFDWGIQVPNDPAHVMYVWVDALTNYLTAIGYPNTQGEMWNYWPATHIIGKDIVRFHAVYWPAMLMSAGLPLPKRIFAHGFVLNDGAKMSKSVGNVVDPFAMIERYGLDKTRYFLMREIPFGQDGSYCHETFINRTNADLANNLGNLAQRSLSMIAKNCAGKVPTPSHFTQEDSDLLARSQTVLHSVRKLMNEQAIHTALSEIIELSSEVNRYFDTQAPWTLRKTDLPRFETVLYVTIETIRCIALLLQPFIPESAEKLLNLMAVEQEHRSFDYVGEKGALRAGDLLPPPVGIFPRFVEEEA